ncbi:MAG: NUDIX domain-containing protein [Propionibacteriales bacterium]|nr:NUDIX domain-containing protein [Propionibacteriales bacterium]
MAHAHKPFTGACETSAVTATPALTAAGAVVWRALREPVEVLLVHRPRYDDWSFPKGKPDADEHPLTTAIREVAEETGLTVRLGPPLPEQRYPVRGAPKEVRYWAAQVCHGDVADYRPNSEIDHVEWFPIGEARRRLSYDRDLDLLDAFTGSPYRSVPLVVLRHARARKRGSWEGPDEGRTLTSRGRAQATGLVPMLRAYGVQQALTSTAVRCAATVQPFADETGTPVERASWLAEDKADPERIDRRIGELLTTRTSAVICSHRPVFPEVFGALGIEDPGLRPGEFIVVHREDGRPHATERHRP